MFLQKLAPPLRSIDARVITDSAFRTHVHHCSCVAGAGGSLLCLPVLPRPEPPPRLRSSPFPSSPSKLPAIPGQGGQGQEQSGSRSTPEKAKGAPTMTAPTMAAPTANMTNISEAGDTAVHHGESSPAAGRGGRTVIHVALQATPPPGRRAKHQRGRCTFGL